MGLRLARRQAVSRGDRACDGGAPGASTTPYSQDLSPLGGQYSALDLDGACLRQYVCSTRVRAARSRDGSDPFRSSSIRSPSRPLGVVDVGQETIEDRRVFWAATPLGVRRGLAADGCATRESCPSEYSHNAATPRSPGSGRVAYPRGESTSRPCVRHHRRATRNGACDFRGTLPADRWVALSTSSRPDRALLRATTAKCSGELPGFGPPPTTPRRPPHHLPSNCAMPRRARAPGTCSTRSSTRHRARRPRGLDSGSRRGSPVARALDLRNHLFSDCSRGAARQRIRRGSSADAASARCSRRQPGTHRDL